jgi:hypothetical protein
MTFARVKPSGWIDGERLYASQVNALDVNVSRALDGTNGGTYTLLSPLTVGGAAWNIGGNATVGGTLAVTGAATFAGAATITGALSAASTSLLTMTGANRVGLTSRTITRVVDSLYGNWNGSDFIMNGAGGFTHAASIGQAIVIALHVPHGATLTEFALLYKGPAHGVWPPGTPPTIRLHASSLSAIGLVGVSYSDSLSSQVTYEGFHWLASGAVSQAIDRTTTRYAIVLITESGSNAALGAQVQAARVTYTTTAYDED